MVTTRTFTYTLTPAPGDTEDAYRRAAKMLGWRCDGDNRIACHGVSGESLGVVIISLTIRGRDKWDSMQIGQDLINDITWNLANPARLEARSVPLEPHEASGYARGGRTKRFRAPKTS